MNKKKVPEMAELKDKFETPIPPFPVSPFQAMVTPNILGQQIQDVRTFEYLFGMSLSLVIESVRGFMATYYADPDTKEELEKAAAKLAKKLNENFCKSMEELFNSK